MICSLCNEHIDDSEKPSLWNDYPVHEECLDNEMNEMYPVQIDPKHERN